MRPDIVVYERGKPIYVLEFKFFSKPDYVNEDAVYDDLGNWLTVSMPMIP